MLEDYRENLQKQRFRRPSLRREEKYPYVDALRGRFPLMSESRILDVCRASGVSASFEMLVWNIECGMEASCYLLERPFFIEADFSKEWLITKAFQFAGMSLVEIPYMIKKYKACSDYFILKREVIAVLYALLEWRQTRAISRNK